MERAGCQCSAPDAGCKHHVGLFCLLQVLKVTAEKFPDFVSSNLAPGVLEAFEFQSRLWSAKHPGQPLPKGEADLMVM